MAKSLVSFFDSRCMYIYIYTYIYIYIYIRVTYNHITHTRLKRENSHNTQYWARFTITTCRLMYPRHISTHIVNHLRYCYYFSKHSHIHTLASTPNKKSMSKHNIWMASFTWVSLRTRLQSAASSWRNFAENGANFTRSMPFLLHNQWHEII